MYHDSIPKYLFKRSEKVCTCTDLDVNVHSIIVYNNPKWKQPTYTQREVGRDCVHEHAHATKQ